MTGADRQAVHEKLEAELSFLWRRLRRLSTVQARQANEGLEVAAYGLLSSLDMIGDIRAGDLAEKFGLDKSTVSRQIAQMEDLGFIQRVPDPQDGRARLIHTTDEGKARIRELREARGRWIRSALDDWSADEVDQLAKLLARLNVSLENNTSEK